MSAIASGLRRVGSFSRSKERRASRGDALAENSHGAPAAAPAGEPAGAPEEAHANSPSLAEKSGGVLGRIARSASFDRKRGSHAKKAGSSREDATKKTDSAREDSGVPMPSKAETAGDSATAEHSQSQESWTTRTDRPLGSLHGWLNKRHCKDKKLGFHWAMRYFNVDDERGTLSYAKSESKKPSVILPISDITSVKEASDSFDYCFVVSCPPVHLTVSAEDREERFLWVQGLQQRMAVWREKQKENGYHVATSEDIALPASPTLLPRDSCVHTPKKKPVAAPAPATAATAAATTATAATATATAPPEGSEAPQAETSRRPAQRTEEEQKALTASDRTFKELATVRAASPRPPAGLRPAHASDDGDCGRAPDTPPGRRAEQAAASAASRSPELVPHQTRAVNVHPRQRLSESDCEAAAARTIEVMSDSDDEDAPQPQPQPHARGGGGRWDSPPHGAVREGAPQKPKPKPKPSKPKTLEEMMSSEEEDDDDLLPSRPPPTRAHGKRREEEEDRPLPTHADAGALGLPVSSLKLQDDDERGGGEATADATARKSQTAADEDWDDDDDGAHGGAHKTIGTGIVADENFVEENWDDDD